MKKAIAVAAACALALTLAGCGSPSGGTDADSSQPAPQEEKKQPLDLAGSWTQTNKNSEDSYHEVTIEADTITVNWITNGGDSKSLYWVGTYVAPTEATDTYTWESAGDTEQLSKSLLGSQDATKVFSYDNGVLSYEFTALGTTTTVKLERQ